ncbi:hypothetical protein PoB_001869800 [Plakobranchus ocellatus]|uniref:Uncharacterized protein n=1 Tax=Plakobranchus ocellatus TaxID=259542 RepID=A0AAV3ZBT5_9GAST|nr:hypothetical protein PoB_001869800 [Plakobranchus ocellatus]
MSDLEVGEWIPDTDEERHFTDEENHPDPPSEKNNSHAPDPDVPKLADIGPTIPVPNFEQSLELVSNFHIYTPGWT